MGSVDAWIWLGVRQWSFEYLVSVLSILSECVRRRVKRGEGIREGKKNGLNNYIFIILIIQI